MYLDIVLLVVVVLSILDGFKNGLFAEFLCIFGVGINFILAKKITPRIMEFLNFSKSDNKYFLVYIGVFWAGYIAISILTHIFRNIIEMQSKGLVTRFLGSLLGAIKGFVICMVIVFIFDFSVEKFSGIKKYGEDSVGIQLFLKVTPTIEEYLPQAFQNKLNSIKIHGLIDRYLDKLF